MSKSSQAKKVLVALSGGVDSSVAAVLLKNQGYYIEGAYMQCWNTGPYCSTEKDRADAAKVAACLGIPFRIFDFEKEYKERVIDYFFSEYEAGRTPNPDVICNKEIKFGIFLKKALELGFEYVATGHYARIRMSDAGSLILDKNRKSSYHLYAGLDLAKDQSYFLYTLTQDQLAKAIFPIGDYTKSEVRKLASEAGLPTANKPDSQGICFVGPVNLAEFLREKIKPKEGQIVNTDGKTIGKHDGIPFYTIGQRAGVGVSSSVPHYVVEKRKEPNKLVVAPVGSRELYKRSLVATNLNWIGSNPKSGDRLQARIRYRQPLEEARIESIDTDVVRVKFSEPQKAVTPGQVVVIYDGAEVLGGGIIDEY
ncbi:MAG: tRNA 2-thiouridine(34) synthase MnmA [Candidatus Woykebacteria bacterium]